MISRHYAVQLVAFAVLFSFVSPAVGLNTSSSIELLDKLKPQIESAYYAADTTVLLNAAAELEQVPGDSIDNWRHCYYQGFVSLKLAEIVIEQDKDRAEDFLNAAVRHLEHALVIEPNVESYALLALVHGSRMAVSSVFGRIGVARTAVGTLDKALAFGQENPRILLVDGTSKIYRPGFAGGGYDEARVQFERALELWNTWSEPDSLMIHWGTRAEIYARWAELEIRNGNTSNARSCIEYALSLQPVYSFVTDKLQPKLEELES